MKVRDLLNSIKQLKADWLIDNNTELVHSEDDEGNGYCPVVFSPSVGYFNPDERQFYSVDDIKEGHMKMMEPKSYKALCIN
jgi:hypothetical protein